MTISSLTLIILQLIINNNNITPDHARRKIREHEGLQRKYAVELREMLTRLGPSFIKFGQVGRDHWLIIVFETIDH